MTALVVFHALNFGWTSIVFCTCIFIAYLYRSYFTNPFPGAFMAKFSDLWLGWLYTHGRCNVEVDKLHKRHGLFVQLGPRHISIASPEALHAIYGHDNDLLKSDFYTPTGSHGRSSMFSTRSPDEHARKRKLSSYLFSPKKILEFEPSIRQLHGQLVNQWDSMCLSGFQGISGITGDCRWTAKDGYAWFDCLPWYNYMTLDIMGEVVLGNSFGMLLAGKDQAQFPKPRVHDGQSKKVAPVPLIELYEYFEQYGTVISLFPTWLRPFINHLPWFQKASKATQELEDSFLATATDRYHYPETEKLNMLNQMQEQSDKEGIPMDIRDLAADTLSFILAGRTTSSHTLCALTYYVAQNPRIQKRLHQELETALVNANTEPDGIPMFADIKDLPYLDAVIEEGHRLFSSTGVGLPRIVPDDSNGITILGKKFVGGTVLSVPTYTLHHDKSLWSNDAEDFRPERWLEDNNHNFMRGFAPFSIGPRACIGRNLAYTMLKMVIATIFYRYHIVLEDTEGPLRILDGFVRRPLEYRIGVKCK